MTALVFALLASVVAPQGDRMTVASAEHALSVFLGQPWVEPALIQQDSWHWDEDLGEWEAIIRAKDDKDRQGRAAVNGASAFVSYWSFPPPPQLDGRMSVSLEEAQGIAWNLVRLVHPVGDRLTLTEATSRDGGSVLVVTFDLYQAGVKLPPHADVIIDARTGYVTAYLATAHIPDVSLVPKITAADARRMLLEAAQAKEARRPEWWAHPEDQLIAFTAGPGGRAYLAWRVHIPIQAKADPQEPLDLWGMVDAHTGQVLWTQGSAARPGKTYRHYFTWPGTRKRVGWDSPCDSWPIWLPGGRSIVFATDRPPPGTTDGRPQRGVAVVRLATAEARWLRSVDGPGMMSGDLTKDGKLLAVGMGQQIGLLDLGTGEWSTCFPSDRPGNNPSFAPDGQAFAFSASRSRGDSDVFVYRVPLGKTSSLYQWRIFLQSGYDCHPAWSPDGTQIAFARGEYALGLEELEKYGDYKRWVLCVTGWQQGSVPTEVLTSPGRVSRLSWFPDSRRLLISETSGKLWVADLNTRALTPLLLDDLRDPDLLEGMPLLPQEATLNAEGNRVAFSAVRWSGREGDSVGQYIYVANLDGTGLKRVTPLDGGTPFALYEFPDAPKRAAEEGR